MYVLKFYMKQINIQENTNLKHLNDLKAFIEYSNDMDDVCKNIKEHNPNKKRKILMVFDDMIVDMLSNKKFNRTVTKLNISLAFITQSYFAVPKILD